VRLLHGIEYAHIDLTSKNILVCLLLFIGYLDLQITNTYEAKLCDFGLSIRLHHGKGLRQPNHGPSYWKAPELYKKRNVFTQQTAILDSANENMQLPFPLSLRNERRAKRGKRGKEEKGKEGSARSSSTKKKVQPKDEDEEFTPDEDQNLEEDYNIDDTDGFDSEQRKRKKGVLPSSLSTPLPQNVGKRKQFSGEADSEEDLPVPSLDESVSDGEALKAIAPKREAEHRTPGRAITAMEGEAPPLQEGVNDKGGKEQPPLKGKEISEKADEDIVMYDEGTTHNINTKQTAGALLPNASERDPAPFLENNDLAKKDKASPKVILSSRFHILPFSSSADIFSYAMILWELFHVGRFPFDGDLEQVRLIFASFY
jgi:serine/threonine protein kinase